MCLWWSMYSATPEALEGALVKHLCFRTDLAALFKTCLCCVTTPKIRGAGLQYNVAQGYLETLDLQYDYFMVEGAHSICSRTCKFDVQVSV